MSDPNQVMIDDVSDMLERFKNHSDLIAVREKVDGKWGRVYLSELSPKKRRDHQARIIVEQIISHINDERR